MVQFRCKVRMPGGCELLWLLSQPTTHCYRHCHRYCHCPISTTTAVTVTTITTAATIDTANTSIATSRQLNVRWGPAAHRQVEICGTRAPPGAQSCTACTPCRHGPPPAPSVGHGRQLGPGSSVCRRASGRKGGRFRGCKACRPCSHGPLPAHSVGHSRRLGP